MDLGKIFIVNNDGQGFSSTQDSDLVMTTTQTNSIFIGQSNTSNRIEIKNGSVTVPTQIQSTVTSTAPFTVQSSIHVPNLNADLLDGQHSNFYLELSNAKFNNGANTVTGVTGTGSIVLNSNPAFNTFTVQSTNLVSNLNADLLDGQHSNFYLDLINATGVLSTAKGGTGTSTSTGTGSIVLNSNPTFDGTTTLSNVQARQLDVKWLPIIDNNYSKIYFGRPQITTNKYDVNSNGASILNGLTYDMNTGVNINTDWASWLTITGGRSNNATDSLLNISEGWIVSGKKDIGAITSNLGYPAVYNSLATGYKDCLSDMYIRGKNLFLNDGGPGTNTQIGNYNSVTTLLGTTYIASPLILPGFNGRDTPALACLPQSLTNFTSVNTPITACGNLAVEGGNTIFHCTGTGLNMTNYIYFDGTQTMSNTSTFNTSSNGFTFSFTAYMNTNINLYSNIFQASNANLAIDIGKNGLTGIFTVTTPSKTTTVSQSNLFILNSWETYSFSVDFNTINNTSNMTIWQNNISLNSNAITNWVNNNVYSVGQIKLNQNKKLVANILDISVYNKFYSPAVYSLVMKNQSVGKLLNTAGSFDFATEYSFKFMSDANFNNRDPNGLHSEWNVGCSSTSIMSLTQGGYLKVSSNVYANGVTLSSDDRIKSEEQYITDGLTLLMKLKPQTYKKNKEIQFIYNSTVDSLDVNSNFDISQGDFESGLIAQEIFYDCPELRHLVAVPKDADPIIYSSNILSSSDPQNDPKEYYKYWGTTTASVNYIGLIPYLIDGIQTINKEKIDLQSSNIMLNSNITSLQSQIDSILARLNSNP